MMWPKVKLLLGILHCWPVCSILWTVDLTTFILVPVEMEQVDSNCLLYSKFY